MVFKSLIKFFIDPFTIFWFLLLAILIGWFFKKYSLSNWLVSAAVVWFLVITTPLIPTLLLHSLENRYAPVNLNDIPDKHAEYHILVLGGGHGFDSKLPANSLLSHEALGRLSEGIRLHRQLPNSRLVLSGFSASGRTTQAEMLQQAAFLLGVKKESTILQREPANTYEEAKVYSNIYGNEHPVILVTSAYHMPRSVQLFALSEVNVLPSPANYRLKGSRRTAWLGLPSLNNIANLDLAIEEYASIVWYDL